MPRSAFTPLLVLLVGGLTGCNSGDAAPSAAAASPATAAGSAQLTAFELEHGIGPVTAPVTLGPVDHDMAEAGKALFATKCSACHKMVDKYVGPPLGDVTTRRSPAFVMNQILNPEAMYTRHPVIKQLLGEYMMQMPNQGLTQDEARRVLEYLRTESHAPNAS